MKVLLLNNRYPSKDKPQVATFIKTIKECLEKAGGSVDLLVNSENADVGQGFRKDLWRYLQKVNQFKRYKDYDIIYCNHLSLYAPGLLNKFKEMNHIIAHWHGTDVIADNYRARLRNKFSHLILPKKILHITPSNYYATVVSKKLDIKFQDILVSPSGGVDVELFNKVKNQDEKNKETITLGFSSGIMESKGIDLVLKMWERKKEVEARINKKLELKIIYYGKHKEKFHLDRAKHKIKLLPVYPKEKMIDFYNQIDILLFPTKRANESLGLVGLESMSCSVPVVGSNDFAIPEYILPGKSGELFQTGNVDDLIDQTIKCIQHLDDYSPRDLIIEKYSRESVIRGYKDLFESLA